MPFPQHFLVQSAQFSTILQYYELLWGWFLKAYMQVSMIQEWLTYLTYPLKTDLNEIVNVHYSVFVSSKCKQLPLRKNVMWKVSKITFYGPLSVKGTYILEVSGKFLYNTLKEAQEYFEMPLIHAPQILTFKSAATCLVLGWLFL